MTKISKNQFIHNIKTAYIKITNDMKKITYGNLPKKIEQCFIIRNDIIMDVPMKENPLEIIEVTMEVKKNAS